MRRLLMALALGTGASFVAGCAGSGHATYGVGVSASYSQPELAYVAPGVYVIADYHEPIFYSNNLWWRYDNGIWYSSRYHDRGWRYSRAPRALVSIERPRNYVRYRPQTRYIVRGDGRVQVRDYRRDDRRRDYRRDYRRSPNYRR